MFSQLIRRRAGVYGFMFQLNIDCYQFRSSERQESGDIGKNQLEEKIWHFCSVCNPNRQRTQAHFATNQSTVSSESRHSLKRPLKGGLPSILVKEMS